MSGLADFGYARELRARRGATPGTIGNPLDQGPLHAISQDEFLLNLPNGASYHYVRGEGVTIDAPDDLGENEIALFQDGPVYGAIAWLNGLVPLHASAVMHNGNAYAFTAASGEGKSTLTAALAREGFALLADDVLALDIAKPGAVWALPGHRRLKLWPDAMALTGLSAGAGARVRPGLDKYYVPCGTAAVRTPVPLAALFKLGSHGNAGLKIRRLTGSDRVAQAHAALYRARLANAVLTPQRQFALAMQIASAVPLFRFERQFGNSEFGAGVTHIADFIRSHDG